MKRTVYFFLSLLIVGLLAGFLILNNTQTSKSLNLSTVTCPKTPLDQFGTIRNTPPSCFDYYAFAQMWLPESCIAKNNSGYVAHQRECQKLHQTFDDQMKPHGLWQSFFTTTSRAAFPADCIDEAFNFEQLPLQLRQSLNRLFLAPVRGLKAHEWEKHGTCDGSSQVAYFQKIIDYNEKFAQAGKLIRDAVGSTLKYEQIINAYGREGQVYLECHQYENGQYLNQIFSLWSKAGEPLEVDLHFPSACRPDKAIHIRPTAEFVSVDDWKTHFSETREQPVVVAFDIDDTVLFSSPGFYYLNQEGVGFSSSKFWNRMNNGLDEFSLPKKIGQTLIDFHQSRGDAIYFITRRGKSSFEQVTDIIKKVFNIQKMNTVIFTDLKTKVSDIQALGTDVYYGDADSDMIEAKKAGAQGVRIMRAVNSNNPDGAHDGAFGEVVILGSAN